ncbi:D-Ala-D-Ala carboxypeptidase family metallohydrolase [Vibrio panuliri]|uniref:Peptidase M15A C-terminal domain-containing protein n=1 Tax=Vibrio panuliri TaxID=1381081 RepID=A0ABX3F6H1_9VIBR|nr:D-Ala-D-Ala carboxypeptidase family metallohydrolase [Vibrio panuliri]OLQ85294.1 hypothetical protein BIY20_16095 [Vibrio panuliri]
MKKDLPIFKRLSVNLVMAVFISLMISGCLYNYITLDIEDGSVVKERMFNITGSVSSVKEGTSVQYKQFPSITAPVATDGTFTLAGLLLPPGETTLTVQSLLNGTVNGETSFKITYQLESGVSALYSADDSTPVNLSVDDPQDPAYGANLLIEAGSVQIPADVKLEVGIVSDAEHMPILPQGYQAVGAPITLQPIGQSFSPVALAAIPYNSEEVAALGLEPLVLALGDNGWEVYPHTSLTGSQLEISISQLFYGGFIAAVKKPQDDQTLVLNTTPSGASVYLNGALQPQLSPFVIENVPNGQNEVKLYIPGYNEKFVSFDMATASVELSEQLVRVDSSLSPLIELVPEITDGLVVSDNVFKLVGTVADTNGTFENGRLVLNLNGLDSFISVTANGEFDHTISLLPGSNSIELRATDALGNTGTIPALEIINREGQQVQLFSIDSTARAAAQSATQNRSITVVLTWSSNDTDVDMHITDPNGNKAWYGSLSGIPGARLDIDDTDGYGPETFTFLDPIPGTYKADVHYYSDHGNGPTTANLSIQVGSRLIFNDSRTLSHRGWWNAHTFDIDDFSIIEVLPNDGVFTTLNGENQLIVTLNVPEHIDPSTIAFEITELLENHRVSTTNGVDGTNSKSIELTHEGLDSLTSPASHKLKYQIKALSGGEETDPVEIVQDVKSQIRQEYVDKRDFRPDFARNTPTRDSIITAANFPAGITNFTFDEFSTYSDYGPTYAVIGESVHIAQTIRQAWGYPLRVTSGWRNPRRNDSLGPSSINSFHQTGDAVDLNPSWNSAHWPQGALTYQQAQQALTNLARNTMNTNYDILFHANHLHVELDP